MLKVKEKRLIVITNNTVRKVKKKHVSNKSKNKIVRK